MPKPNYATRKLTKANQQRVIKKCTRKAREVIDIDHYKPNTKVKATYSLHKTHPQLKKEDRATIETGKWLTDDIVNASLNILKEEFGGSGLQKVNCGLVMNFTIEAAEFIQIVHDPIRQHRLLISKVGAKKSEVMVYDSLFNSLSQNVKQQVSCLLCTEEARINVELRDVHSQSGGSDCGLYAIAYETALCLGQQQKLE